MKNLLFSFRTLVAVFLLCGVALYAANETQFRITNLNRVDANHVSFELIIKNVSGSPIEFSGFLPVVNYNTAIVNGGTGSCVQNASNLPSNVQNNTVFTLTNPAGAIRVSSKTPPGAGSGYVLADQNEVMVARWTFATSAAIFANQNANFVFRPVGSATTYCKVTAYVASVNTNIESNSTFSADNIQLPVELTSFTAAGNGRNIDLKWSTATEVNAKSFDVQRSSNNADWKTIGSVAAAGNSNSKKDYSFTDKKLNSGKYSYRLVQTDNNGASRVIGTTEGKIDVPTEFKVSQNYPNPFNPSTSIDYQLPQNAQVSIELYSMNGQKIAQIANEQQTAGYYTVTVGSSIASGLASGVYLYRVSASGMADGNHFTSVKKMILMK